MRNAMNLFGERSLTLVAALFDNGVAAARAAGNLQRHQQGERCAVMVVEPHDPRLGRKLEPESTGIWHTMLRTHGKLAVLGALVGALIGAVLLMSDWAAADAAPVMTMAMSTIYGAFAGGLLAGLLTLRPDRSRVIADVRDATDHGRWAVVAHPRSPEQADAARRWLASEGGDVLQSL